ncbi:MAG TPA: dephospho-CoA kinase [Vicinamibacterales bacterium]|nr:dephospho-CoA kinase [Vicinamibacterales bacterium]
MRHVALTGGIATGKSFCLARFGALGAAVIDADVIAREVVIPGSPGLTRIVERFGPAMLRPDGSLDRPALAAVVFADRTARAALEAIVHPEVYRRISEWFANLPQGPKVAIADIPLLFETGHEHEFERVIVCVCEPGEQLRRIMRRSNLSLEEARARVATQWPTDEKVARADYVISTDGTFAETEAQVESTYALLLGS